MSNIRYNKSKTYLLPLLSELVNIDKKFFPSLENTYIFDDTGKYENCIFILHDFSFRVPEYTHYEHRLIESPLFVDLIDVGNQVVYIFKFPEDYLHEYNCFKEGKYSKFGVDAKELILEFFTHIYSDNMNAIDFLLDLKHVLFKSKRLKTKIERSLNVTLSDDAELSDSIEIEDETIKLSKLIEKKEKKEQK